MEKGEKTIKITNLLEAPGKITKAPQGYLEYLEGQRWLETHIMCK